MVTKGSSYVVELVHGLYQESPRLMELEVGLHHGCLDSDHRSPGVVELVMKLHHGSPTVMKLVMRLHQGCYIRQHRHCRLRRPNLCPNFTRYRRSSLPFSPYFASIEASWPGPALQQLLAKTSRIGLWLSFVIVLLFM